MLLKSGYILFMAVLFQDGTADTTALLVKDRTACFDQARLYSVVIEQEAPGTAFAYECKALADLFPGR